MEAGKRAVEHILSWVQPRADEICAVHLRSRSAAGNAVHQRSGARCARRCSALTAIGSTSLYDAIGDTAKKLGNRPSPRRAVVVITDGMDTSSTMKPSDVSGIASAIDVPVYVIAVRLAARSSRRAVAVVSRRLAVSATISTTWPHWTGGNLTLVSTPAHASLAARELITELRHQYLLAFEAAKEAGWY